MLCSCAVAEGAGVSPALAHEHDDPAEAPSSPGSRGRSAPVGPCVVHHGSTLLAVALCNRDLTDAPDLSGTPLAQSINLSFNCLARVPALAPCRGLVHLNLAHNSIDSLPEDTFVGVPQLQWLDLSHNRIANVFAVSRATSLQTLWLNGNPLRSLRQVAHLHACPRLRHLFVAGTTLASEYPLGALRHFLAFRLPALEVLCVVAPRVSKRAPVRGGAEHAGVHAVTPAVAALARQWVSSREGRSFLSAVRFGVACRYRLPTRVHRAAGRRVWQVNAEPYEGEGTAVVVALPRSMPARTREPSAAAHSPLRGSRRPVASHHPVAAATSRAAPSGGSARRPRRSDGALREPSQSVSPPPPPAPHDSPTGGTVPTGAGSIAAAVGSLPDLSGFGTGGGGKPRRAAAPPAAGAGSKALRTAAAAAPRAHPWPDATSGPDARAQWPPGALDQVGGSGADSLPTSAPVGYTARHAKAGGGVAVEVRRDGSATGRWPSGALAVSVELDPGATASFNGSASRAEQRTVCLYRVVACCRQAKGGAPTVAFDAFGAGGVQLASGASVLTAMDDGSGFMVHPKSGVMVRRWDTRGNVVAESTDAAEVPGVVYDADAATVRVTAGKGLGVVYSIRTRSLEVFFKCEGVHHRFVQGFNPASATLGAGRGLFGDRPVAARKPSPVNGGPQGHVQTLADIRAAVASLT